MVRLAHIPLLVALLTTLGSTTFAQPRLSASIKEIDLGYRLVGEPFSHTFIIKNEGATPLELEVTSKSCGCVNGLPEGSIAAGSQGNLMVGYTPHASASKKGQNTFAITLRTNDPDSELVVFSVKADIVEPVHSTSQLLVFRNVGAEGAQQLEIVCLREGEMPEVKSIEADTPDIVVLPRRKEASNEATQYIYDVSLKPEIKRIGHVGVVKVFTDSSRVPQMEIPVKVILDPVLVAFPPKGAFGVVKRGERKALELDITWQQGSGPVRATSSDDQFLAEFKTETPFGGKLNLEFAPELAASDKPSIIRSRVELLDGDGELVGTIPVLAVVAP